MPHDTHPTPPDAHRASGQRKQEPPKSRAPAAFKAMLIAGLAIFVVAAIPNPSSAQGARPMTTRGQAATTDADRAALATLGLDLSAIEDCRDVALLWRAVRELVLPGRVSEVTQRRILRRVFAFDPEISQGSYVASPTH